MGVNSLLGVALHMTEGDIDSAVAEFKDEIKTKEKEVNELHRQLGKRTAELEWAAKKLKSLDYETRKCLIESEPKNIPVTRQCELINFNRSNCYYKSVQCTKDKMELLRAIDRIYTETPFYGYRKVHQQLIEGGYSVGLNRVRNYMNELGLKVIYPTKKVYTTLAHPEHKKYPYLLRDLEIYKPNQVWSTDITYIRLDGGFVYLAAVIDWHSKAILSHKISTTMDSSLVINVLKQALERYGTPEIFNTDQGSQYTSHDHTQLLIDRGIKISMDGKGRATDNIANKFAQNSIYLSSQQATRYFGKLPLRVVMRFVFFRSKLRGIRPLAIERFWRSAKYENIYLSEYANIKELKAGVTEYIEFYNNKRFHQTLDYKKPMDVYCNLQPQLFLEAA
ncbi:putative transposase OrfB [Piscirickettsia salmonis]|uniref:IS3 family transposase n=1 Tax=Piscirickettsia salmonis TaxID=1238 RepID=UPI0012BAB925|nr:IS3 family transposase [Piscirickettsia salmonis]QGP54798.1 putative transposase OrfB [Piscirickettsia salmonis]QGP59309.1 putative transposase OrfB [Piscirickettsia salmonis]QGP64014.1 putative transposase OrfB [Piscirickettsia salmonis]